MLNQNLSTKNYQQYSILLAVILLIQGVQIASNFEFIQPAIEL
jgi:hypothetical protein